MDVFEGRISSTGFSSGDRIVIGDWRKSRLGSFTNVMWAKPDGTRILLSPSEEHAHYVSELYNFEEVEVVEIEVIRGNRGISVEAGELSVQISWGASFPLPFWRPLWFTATIESFFGKLLFGTKTAGETKNGRREWYSVRGISRVIEANAWVNGSPMGSKGAFLTDACFGFSEPPKSPSSVLLKAIIE
jgi:hypothetical protein